MSKEKKLIPKLRFPDFEKDGEWELKTLGEVAPLQRGFDLPVDSIVFGEYPVVFSNGILKFHNEYKVKGPGIVTGRSGTIGRVTFVEKNFWPHNTSLWVTDFFGNSPLFIFYYYCFIDLKQFGTGSGVPTLNRNDVHRQKILVPISIQEQQKIASCLSSLDELIAAHNDKLQALKDHKKGLMQNLFPPASSSHCGPDPQSPRIPPYRFPEFDEDGEWELKSIGSIAKISAGGTPSSTEPKYWGGNIPWMNSGELNLKRVYSVENYITPLGLKESSTKKIPPRCILIGLAGQGKTRGTAAINYIELCTNQSIAAIHPNMKNFDSEFLYNKIDSMYKTLRSLSTGQGGRGGLNLSIIREIEIPFPSIQEQQKIASCLSALDDLITAQSEKIEQLKEHKKGLMQGLFPKIV